MMHLRLTLVLFLVAVSAVGQDTSEVFTFPQFLEAVRSYHPMSKQALLARERGDAQLREARGGFDPKLYHNSDKKDFKDSPYFFHSSTGVKLPLWFGLEVKGQYELANGQLLNPENTVPNTGLSTVGVSFTPLQGLFMDQRRADLKSAKIFRELAEVEQQKMLNKLFQKASKVYWKWSVAEQKRALYTESYELSQERIVNLRSNYFNGDKSAFDTLEAFTQMQQRFNLMMEASRNAQIARAAASAYLWSQEQTPVTIPEAVQPESIQRFGYTLTAADSVGKILSDIENRNPELQGLEIKVQEKNIKRRLAAEALKPQLNLNYNFLNEGFALEGEIFNPAYFENNYKWGIEFSYPLLIRKARGKLQQVKIDQETLELEKQRRLLEIENEITALINAYQVINRQMEVSTEMVENFNQLFLGETTRFINGESNFFLVNTRELYYLDATVKLLELNYEQVEIGTEIDFLLGTLPGGSYLGN